MAASISRDRPGIAIPDPLFPTPAPVRERLLADIVIFVAKPVKIAANKSLVPLVLSKDDNLRGFTHLPIRERLALRVRADCRDHRETLQRELHSFHRGRIVLHSSEPID